MNTNSAVKKSLWIQAVIQSCWEVGTGLKAFILSKRAGWSENRAHDLVFSWIKNPGTHRGPAGLKIATPPICHLSDWHYMKFWESNENIHKGLLSAGEILWFGEAALQAFVHLCPQLRQKLRATMWRHLQRCAEMHNPLQWVTKPRSNYWKMHKYQKITEKLIGL